MVAELFKNKITELCNNADKMGIIVYAITKSQNNVLRLDIQDKYSNDLKNFYIEHIKNIADDELEVLRLSACDDRKNVIYLYDLNDVPEDFKVLQENMKECSKFSLDNSFSNIKALLIQIGNESFRATLYKILRPISIFSGARHLFFIKSKTQLSRIEDEFLRFDSNFQIIQVQDDLYIKDIKILENMGFYEILKKEAQKGLQSIINMEILDNVEPLEELLDDVKYARKLTNITQHSPVLKAKVTNDKIINFCNSHPTLKGKIKFNEDKSKIILDTKVSKDLFIKVLMDNFLTSQLTNYQYESKAKDNIG